MSISARGNQYLQDNRLDNALLKNQPERCAEVLVLAVNLIYALGPLVHPFMPDTADSIARQTNAPLRKLPEEFSVDLLEGHGLGQPQLLFTKIGEKKEDEWRKAYGGESTGAAAIPGETLSKKQLAKRAKEAAAAQAASLPRTPEVIALEEKIKAQGGKVAAMKKEKIAGEELDKAVAELKMLKAELDVLALELKAKALEI